MRRIQPIIVGRVSEGHTELIQAGGRYFPLQVVQCPACHKTMLYAMTDPPITRPGWFSLNLSDHIPESIRNFVLEAHRSFAAGATQCAAFACRRVLETVCQEKGAPEGFLPQKLEWLMEQGFLVPPLVRQARAITLVGNDAVHNQPVTREEVSTLMRLLLPILECVFVYPNIAEDLIQRHPPRRRR